LYHDAISAPPNILRLALLIIDVQKRGLRGLAPEHGSTPERAFDFVNNVRDTANTLRETLGIPAYVVALDKHNRIYPDEISDPSQQNKDARKKLNINRGLIPNPDRIRGRSGENALSPQLYLTPQRRNEIAPQRRHEIFNPQSYLNPRPDEIIVSKNENGVFVVDGSVEHSKKSEFAKHLEKSKINGVIIVGMDSELCVASSAHGAIRDGLQCIVLTDCLAQSFYNHEGKNGGDPAWHESAVRQGIDEATASKVRFATKDEFCDDPWKYLSKPEPTDIRAAAKPLSPKSALIAER
jgi:nicotinamidase-related amidase